MAAGPLVRLLEQMDDGLNLLNIILLAIAVGVFLKLRSVLGRRTGHERPPYDPYSGDAAGNDKVVTLPKRPRDGTLGDADGAARMLEAHELHVLLCAGDFEATGAAPAWRAVNEGS